MKIFTVLLSAALVLGMGMPSYAQGWLDRAKGALNSDLGKTVTQGLGGSDSSNSSALGAALNTDQISAGLREALRIGAERVVKQLSASGGFNLDPEIHIPLPATLGRVDKALSAVGLGDLTTDLEKRMNLAAEQASVQAKDLFVSAISNMTIDDARAILGGSSGAATDYLRRVTGGDLSAAMMPIIATALSETGAIKAYDSMLGEYGKLPFVPDVQTNLQGYVAGKAMDGIFYYIGQEEAAIRANPAARTTDLLKTVFGGE